MGGILFHEFGHLWAHAISDGIILNSLFSFSPVAAFYVYPSKVEDDADFISGILSKKAKHDRMLSMEWIDIMAFAHLYRIGATFDFGAVVSSYSLQLQQSSASYSSLANRKGLIQMGYDLLN